jgi:hypothetical protein
VVADGGKEFAIFSARYAGLPAAAVVIRYTVFFHEGSHATASTCRQDGLDMPGFIELLFGAKTLPLARMR